VEDLGTGLWYVREVMVLVADEVEIVRRVIFGN
jgi:hypothetical protein